MLQADLNIQIHLHQRACEYSPFRKIQNTEYRIRNTEYRIQNTEYEIQNIEYRIQKQNTEYRIQSTWIQCKGSDANYVKLWFTLLYGKLCKIMIHISVWWDHTFIFRLLELGCIHMYIWFFLSFFLESPPPLSTTHTNFAQSLCRPKNDQNMSMLYESSFAGSPPPRGDKAEQGLI